MSNFKRIKQPEQSFQFCVIDLETGDAQIVLQANFQVIFAFLPVKVFVESLEGFFGVLVLFNDPFFKFFNHGHLPFEIVSDIRDL